MLDSITTKVFADGADLEQVLARAEDPRIRGFTTNPTLMWKAGLTDYEEFARRLLDGISDRPISFEVFADEGAEIRRQSLMIADWGENVYVKVPVTTTDGAPLADLIRELSQEGVKVNVTALMTVRQVEVVAEALSGGAPSCISIFAGRIADAGVDPVPMLRESCELVHSVAPRSEVIWASPREVLNLVQADSVGCDIITMTDALLGKLHLLGADLDTFSLETVKMFHRDAAAAGFSL